MSKIDIVDSPAIGHSKPHCQVARCSSSGSYQENFPVRMKALEHLKLYFDTLHATDEYSGFDVVPGQHFFSHAAEASLLVIWLSVDKHRVAKLLVLLRKLLFKISTLI